MADSPRPRTAYGYWRTIPTRWMDNDIYGHVNNVVYYSYFDTVINAYLIDRAGLDIHNGPSIGLCVESHCRYFAPLAFPADVEAGLTIDTIGRSSVRYSLGLFTADGVAPAAEGWFVHVFVDRTTRTAEPIPPSIRRVLEILLTAA